MGILAVLTIVNLRGVRSAGVVFMVPTYAFLLCLGITIVIGIARILYGHPVPVVRPLVRESAHAATTWLLIRAFASGCTALTGIEAVSNAVPIFQKPAIVLARRTLSIIMIMLAVLLAGVAFLSYSYGSLVLNALGGLATAATLIVITISKFTEGAWLTIVVIPPLVLMFLSIRRRYRKIEGEAADAGPLDTAGTSAPIIVIPIKQLDHIARKALRLALALSEDIYVVQILAEHVDNEDLSGRWADVVEKPFQKIGHRAPQLVVLKSSYREFFDPLLGYVRRLASDHRNRTVAVVVPELVQREWYHFLIPHRAALIKELLLLKGRPQIVIVDAPWYLRGERPRKRQTRRQKEQD